MKKLEIGLIGTFLFGCLLHIYHIPFAGLTVTFSALILSLLYTLLGAAIFNDITIAEVFKKESPDNPIAVGEKIVGVFAGMAGSTSVLAVLFSVQRWNGLLPMCWAAFCSSLLVLIICTVLYLLKRTKGYKASLKRTAILFSIVIILWSVSKMYHEIDLEQFKAEIESYQ